MVEDSPVAGVGIGGQARASRRLAGSDRPTPNFVSHTTPLTVFAELGAIGLALYVWLLVGGALPDRCGAEARQRARARAGRLLPRPLRARALLQRLPRGPDHVARPGRRRGLPRWHGATSRAVGGRARARAHRRRSGEQRAARAAWALRGVAARRSSPSPCRSSAPTRGPSGPGGRSAGAARPARARGGRGVGRGHRARGRVLRGAAVRRGRGAAAAPARGPGRAGPGSRSCWPSACCCWRPPPCSRSGCATPPRPGSSRTTRPTRSSWAGSCCSTSTTPTATTTASRAGALLHPRRQRLRAGPRARGGARALRLLPRRRRSARPPGGCCPSRSTTTGCSCSWRPSHAPAALLFRAPLGCGSPSGRCSSATRSPCARRGSGRTTLRACCCSCSPSRSSRAAASAGRRPRWRRRSC